MCVTLESEAARVGSFRSLVVSYRLAAAPGSARTARRAYLGCVLLLNDMSMSELLINVCAKDAL